MSFFTLKHTGENDMGSALYENALSQKERSCVNILHIIYIHHICTHTHTHTHTHSTSSKTQSQQINKPKTVCRDECQWDLVIISQSWSGQSFTKLSMLFLITRIWSKKKIPAQHTDWSVLHFSIRQKISQSTTNDHTYHNIQTRTQANKWAFPS